MTNAQGQSYVLIDSTEQNFEHVTSKINQANVVERFPKGQRLVALLECPAESIYSLNTRELFNNGWLQGFGIWNDQQTARHMAQSYAGVGQPSS
jgi:hypothetical protein